MARKTNLLQSFNWAFEGIVHALRSERNMWIHFGTAILVLVAALFFSLSRLEVVAHLRNRENRRIEVQANCVFKDQNGFSTGDETPFVAVILTENATEDVRFVSMNNLARKYTIRVRQAR